MSVPDRVKKAVQNLAKKHPLGLQGMLYQHRDTKDYWVVYATSSGPLVCPITKNTDIERVQLIGGFDDYIKENNDKLILTPIDDAP